MTRQKSLKARVRARMAKTGERYTAARRQLLDPPPESTTDDSARPVVRAATKRMSDEAVRGGTGRGWQEWFTLLDTWDAPSHPHAEIARWLVDEHGVGAWWAQSVSVAYEQERGMRVPSQIGDGEYAASASKTINVAAGRVAEAFTDPALRERWLPGARVDIRASRSGKSLSADWNGGTSRLSVYLTAKSDSKCQVAVQHVRLPDPPTAERMKAHWRTALAQLKSLLEA